MTLMPVDPPDGSPSGEVAPAHREPAGSPAAAGTTAFSPEAAARENARGGRWAMNDYFDGWVLLGADNKPVMRNDGSQVGFFFHDAKRLAGEHATKSGRKTSPESTAGAVSPAAAAWLASRRALAPLDSGLNDDWDPQVQKSYFATITNWKPTSCWLPPWQRGRSSVRPLMIQFSVRE